MKKIVCAALAVIMAAALLCGCSGAPAASGAPAETTNVVFLNWGEYIDPDVLAEFNAANPGVNVSMKMMTSNEEMYVACATEGSEVDIVVPSEYMVERMINEDLLAELDMSNIPNFKNVEAMAKTRTFDPESKYSVPYMRGTLGIVYNTKLVDDVVDSWDILWNEKYSKKIMMYDSIRDSIAVALSKLGYSINSTDPAELKEAGELLKAQKPLVLAYGTDDIKTSMAAGTVALAVDYSGAAAAAIMENPDLKYVVPKEKGNVWVDNLVVLKSSKHKAAAEKFINYLMDTEISARNAEFIGYTSPDPAAMEILKPDYGENTGMFINDEDAARCEYYKDLGADALEIYNDVWMEVKNI